MSIREAADSDDRLKLLLAMRSRVSDALDDPECPARDLASLTRRLQDISKDIAEIRERLRQEAQRNDSTNGKTWDPTSV